MVHPTLSGRALQQPFHNGIVDAGAEFPDPHVRTGGVHPVGQEHHGNPPVEIQPERGPGKPQMPYAAG